jgi:hypothetical protein
VGTTTVNGINDRGDLVGFYVDAAGNTDGFLAMPSGHTGFTNGTTRTGLKGDSTVGGRLTSPPSAIGGQGQQDNALAGIAGSLPNPGSGGNVSLIDAFFQEFNSTLSSLESRLEAMDQQTIAFFQTVNVALDSLESATAGHPISI